MKRIMKRTDCAYCIDLDEQGALCDHPLRLDCGEPVEARCSIRCAEYERRMSVVEALARIHDLEAKLAESEKWRARYKGALLKYKVGNYKLRELVWDMWNDACQFDDFADYVNDDGEIYSEDELPHYQERMRELGIEVE